MRKMSRVVEKVKGHVAGLDVHKNQITYCVLDRKGCEVAAGQFLATRERLGGFLAEYVGRKTFHFALEASGYSLWVYDLLCASHGREKVHVAHAAHIRLITHSTKKNDDSKHVSTAVDIGPRATSFNPSLGHDSAIRVIQHRFLCA